MKRLAVGVLFFFGVTTAVLATELVSPSTDYDALVSALKASEQPVCSADIAVKIPDSQNAAPAYMNAAKVLSTPSGSDVYQAGQLLDPNFHGKSSDLWKTARAMAVRYTGVVGLVEKASSMPQCRYPAGVIGPHGGISYAGYEDARLLTTFLSTSALLYSRDGKMDDSTRCLGLAYKVAESLRDEPALYGFATRERCHETASQALHKILLGKFDALHAKKLFDQLGTVDFCPGFKTAIMGQRAIFIESQERTKPTAGTSGKPVRVLQPSPKLVALKVEELKAMQGLIDNSSVPCRSLPGSASSSPSYSLAFSRDTDSAKIAGDRILLALCAYHSKFHLYPKSLSDLETKLKWNLPVDPFSGKSFKYKTAGKGFVLYSIGANLRDDQGTSPKAGESSEVVGDIVWKQDS